MSAIFGSKGRGQWYQDFWRPNQIHVILLLKRPDTYRVEAVSVTTFNAGVYCYPMAFLTLSPGS